MKRPKRSASLKISSLKAKKLKTKKSVKKRFKITKRGKVIHIRSRRAIVGRRAKKIKRMLGK